VRNKPIEPPKKPEKAPFFLPSVPSLSGEILFKPSEPVDGEDTKPDKAESDKRKLGIPETQFLGLLQSSSEMKNCEHFSPCTVLLYYHLFLLMCQLKAL
jgi:U3 small nucleolar RNA-associated protein 21